MPPKQFSWVWDYFEIFSEKLVKCKSCGNKVSRDGTSAMSKHLTIHKIDKDSKRKAEDEILNPAKRSKVQETMDSYIEKESIELILSRLAARDGISIRTITLSEDIIR